MLTEEIGDSLDIQCRGESPTPIGKIFSISTVRPLMRVLIEIRGLSLIQQFVQSQLDETLSKIDSSRTNAPLTIAHIKYHGHANLSALELLGLIRNYERKNNLRDKEIDLSRFSPIEIHELERLYNYIIVIGRGALYNEMMDIIEDNNEKTPIEKSELILSNIDFYMSYMKEILIRYYRQELSDAEENLESTYNLLERTTVDDASSLISNIHIFTQTRELARNKLKKLNNQSYHHMHTKI